MIISTGCAKQISTLGLPYVLPLRDTTCQCRPSTAIYSPEARLNRTLRNLPRRLTANTESDSCQSSGVRRIMFGNYRTQERTLTTQHENTRRRYKKKPSEVGTVQRRRFGSRSLEPHASSVELKHGTNSFARLIVLRKHEDWRVGNVPTHPCWARSLKTREARASAARTRVFHHRTRQIRPQSKSDPRSQKPTAHSQCGPSTNFLPMLRMQTFT